MYEGHEQVTFSVTVELANAPVSEEALLLLILQEFGVVSHAAVAGGRLAVIERPALIRTLDAFLRSLGAIGAHGQVFIRGAQHLSPETVPQILSDATTERATLLQIVLVERADEAAARPRRRSGRVRPYLMRVAAGLLLAAMLGGGAAAAWHYREYATAFVQRVIPNP